MADNNQVMITVKKADGTTERISLDELKKRQANAAVPATISAPVAPPVVKSAPVAASVVLPPTIKSEPIENKPIFKTEDSKPLLHEEAPQSEHAVNAVVSGRTDQVSKIIDSLSFKVSAQVDSRLRSIIQLRLKDIRSEADTLDACSRSIKDGGLGLTETQARELTDKSKPTTYTPKVEKKETKENIVDKIIGGSATASAPIEDLIAKASEQKPVQNATPFRAASVTPRAMMHDVHTKPQSMGPLDEIQYFSLVDFRRLSSKPADAAERLKQKFLNLKEESYLLFMKSWEAWHLSPLYQSYVSAVDEALEQKRTLAGVLGEREKISLAEIEALINLEKDLAI